MTSTIAKVVGKMTSTIAKFIGKTYLCAQKYVLCLKEKYLRH